MVALQIGSEAQSGKGVGRKHANYKVNYSTGEKREREDRKLKLMMKMMKYILELDTTLIKVSQ
jgi:hypothetical protein